MAGVKTLADKRYKVTLLSTEPTDLRAITTTELQAGIDASCLLAANGTRLSATGSDSINDPAVCEESTASVPGGSNFEATFAPFWYLDPATGQYAEADNPAFEIMREKGSAFWAVTRRGPEASVDWAAGDTYSVFEVTTDNPQEQADSSGWIKYNVPAEVQRAELFQTVAA